MTTMGTVKSGHFSGGQNLNEGSRAGADTILEEFVSQARVDVVELEANVSDLGSVAVAQLIFAGLPTAADTLEIGADTYEYDGVGSNINVVIAGTVTLTIDNLVEAINERGTEHVVADKLGTTICRIRSAATRGGVVASADPSIALDASNQTDGSFDVGNVNMNTLAGNAGASRAMGVAVLPITTAMITATHVRVAFPFTVTRFTYKALTAAGRPVAFTPTTGDTLTIANGDVLLTLTGDLANTDVVTIVAYE